ncbi:MAG: hypothetical protein PHT94_02015 [Candidatus Nanoarchaeia archaeon]|nr:hypothetical protein [Candidatus Nanoarchaeia archaeon]
MKKKAIIGSVLSTLMYTILFLAVVIILILFFSNKNTNQNTIQREYENTNRLLYDGIMHIDRIFINQHGEIEIHFFKKNIIDKDYILVSENFNKEKKYQFTYENKEYIISRSNAFEDYQLNIYNYNTNSQDFIYIYTKKLD